MKRAAIGAGIGVWLALSMASAVQAQSAAPPQVVVELFTSQGCSSCPPADTLLREIAAQPGVLALSLHVDYWDYLGWEDTLAQPAFSMRQKAYAYAAEARAVFTPQAVVGGVVSMNGADGPALRGQIANSATLPQQVQLHVQREGTGWLLEATASPPLPSEVVVQLVRYVPEVQVTILRGENAGHQASYVNVATEWLTLAEWDGASPLHLEIPGDGMRLSAVIVQAVKPGGRYAALPGKILAAARLD
ncbi:DUF1223 domain-containing protein [Phaeovulum sp.]|uniref:DUF1223 domain-containing protein n=1 Tax=Phaeovulum sp. TaxID=2934796 RepID=UPI003568131C